MCFVSAANPPKTPPKPPRRPYQSPRVLWREPYEPMSFGISCAKQPGNPQCNPGPTSG
jgi:hypothetical protein